ncbi:MAG: hypothetical protein HYV14_16055 [Elusimicrobia bacterium]|nr:hypothetical protein [Elusimicrobiota bacterium]
MNRLAAGLAVLIATSASAAPELKPAPARTAGKVLKSQSKISPSADGPVFREGRLTLLDKAGRTEDLKVSPRTKVTLDGKPAKFQKAAVAGALVLKGLYDPNTKELSALDLKSGPKPEADAPGGAEAARGEVANTDVLKGVLTVRTGRQAIREFTVPETAKIVREAEGKPGEAIPFEALQVGDAVEVLSADGKAADEIHARAAR